MLKSNRLSNLDSCTIASLVTDRGCGWHVNECNSWSTAHLDLSCRYISEATDFTSACGNLITLFLGGELSESGHGENGKIQLHHKQCELKGLSSS